MGKSLSEMTLEELWQLFPIVLAEHRDILFRDYLNGHPEVAHEYERLKLGLWKQFEHDRDGYTNAKTEFVRRWTDEARKTMEGTM